VLQITLGAQTLNMLLNGLCRLPQGLGNFSDGRGDSLLGKIALNEMEDLLLLFGELHSLLLRTG